MNEITLPAHAKINLTLDVGKRRADGYHDLRSIMQAISLHDTLAMRRLPGRPGIVLNVTGTEAAGVPCDTSNLAYRAAARLLEIAGIQGTVAPGDGLQMTLHKQIPAQAGLGGGSADAAAALQATDALLGLRLPWEQLTTIGAELGADVPFFLTGGTALVEGVGERVTPLPDRTPPWFLVIVKPPVGVPTAWAYAALDAAERPGHSDATDRWLSGSGRPANDFHPVIVPAFPEIAAADRFLRTDPDRQPETPPLLCGSGSALFCRAVSPAGAQRMAERARMAGIGQVWAAETVGRQR